MSQTQSALPHLPHGMTIPQVQVSESTRPMMPGQKMIKASSESDEESMYDTNQPSPHEQQMIPQPQPQQQQYHRATQGIPMNERSQQQLVNLNPPPMFSAKPKRMSTIRKPNPRLQKDVHRLESGIDPVGVMSNRLEAWRSAIKDLVAVFKKIADSEENCAKGWVGAGRSINVPFRASNGQFIRTGGIQDVWTSIRDYSNEHGMLHRKFATYVRDTLIPSLRAAKGDIKKMLVSIQNDKQLKNTEIFENRMKLDKNISKLERNIQSVDRSSLAASQCRDPFLVNLAVIHAIRELCDHENRLHDSALALQREVGVFEQKIIENCRYIMQHLKNFRLENKMEDTESISAILQTFDTIQPFTEWNDFITRNQYSLVMENSAYKTEDSIQYPNQQHKYVRASKIGHLSTKQGNISKNWVEGVCVLTPAGFLHYYKTPQYFQARATQPTFSVYIPDNTVIPVEGGQNTFIIKNKLKNAKKSNGISLSSFNVSTSYAFSARSKEESLEWQQALNAITSRYEAVPLITNLPAPVHQQHRNLPPMPSHVLPHMGPEHTSDGASMQSVPQSNYNEAAPSQTYSYSLDRELPEDPLDDDEDLPSTSARKMDATEMASATASGHDALQNPSISPYDILNMAKVGMGNSSVPASGAFADPGLSDLDTDHHSWNQEDDMTHEDEDLTHETHTDATHEEEEEEITHEDHQDELSPETPTDDTHEDQEEEVLLSDEKLTNDIHQLINPSEQDPTTTTEEEEHDTFNVQ